MNAHISLTRQGFTLIELLIVVAIIAILAAIAVPNFLEAQTRSKVSRAQSDMRTLALAIEAYRVDKNAYPVTSGFPQTLGPPGPPQQGPPPAGSSRLIPALGFSLWAGDAQTAGLVAPIAYVSSIPIDPFDGLRADDLYINERITTGYYFTTRNFFRQFGPQAWQVSRIDRRPFPQGTLADWVLQSKGPDMTWARSPADGGADRLELSAPYAFEYDPTNGTISTGNLVRSNQ